MLTSSRPQVQPWGDRLGAGSRVVAYRWKSVPLIDVVIDDVTRTLARIVLADWPCWYGRVLIGSGGENEFERNVNLRSELKELSRQQIRILRPWLKRAAELCLRGEIPFDPESSRELQAAQLALAVCSQELIIVLCAGPGEASGGAPLFAIAEWLRRVTGAAIVLLVPLAWKDLPELQRLGKERETLCVGIPVEETDPTSAVSCLSVSVTSLPGRPHPNSDVEQLLYQRIKADEELAPLLEFNQAVAVDLEQKYQIDILCRTRRVAIEIDGSEHRITATKYAADCERDYRLMKDGYLVTAT